MCRAIQEMIQDGVELGKLEGKAEGKIEGKIEGKVEGKAEGKREGKIEGKIEGKVNGQQDSILEVLSLFGELPQEVSRKVRKQQSLEVLRNWLRLAVQVRSVEEFGRRI